MTKIGILLLAIVLFIPSVSVAQSATANRAWQPFWVKFSSAVNKRSRSGVKALMSSERDFFDGGGGGTRDEWLNMIEQERLWPLLLRSVRSGTKPNGSYQGRLSRVTKDNGLVFTFIAGRWRFTGPMGD